MLVISDAGLLPERYKNVVAAIGVFDGVHQGHQRVIGRAVARARRIGGTSVVVTFFPHPAEVLRPEVFQGYVSSLDQRVELIASLGAQVCYVIPFSRAFAQMTAGDFVERYLVGRLRAGHVVIGEDFHFGRGRRGLASTFAAHGLGVTTVPLFSRRRTAVKTRKIKQMIGEGDLAGIKSFLARDYGVLSLVVRGKGIGRRLGFPTANLQTDGLVTLPSGIYAVRVLVGKQEYAGAAYIGTRPTIKRHRKVYAVEVHLLDFKGDLYGRRIHVDFLKKLRDDRVFPDEKTLVNAIASDISAARRYFLHHS
jgi:riboflavin kinase/FMN adenylyltransferase